MPQDKSTQKNYLTSPSSLHVFPASLFMRSFLLSFFFAFPFFLSSFPLSFPFLLFSYTVELSGLAVSKSLISSSQQNRIDAIPFLLPSFFFPSSSFIPFFPSSLLYRRSIWISSVKVPHLFISAN